MRILCGHISIACCRFQLLEVLPEGEREIKSGTLVSKQFPSLSFAILDFLKEEGTEVGEEGKWPSVATLGISGSVFNNSFHFTNLGWVVNGEELSTVLKIEKVLVLNDYVLLAFGVRTISQNDMIALNDAPSIPFAPVACIGVGNGMGKAYLTSAGDTYTVWPTEGGHVDLAPANPIEFELLNFLREKHHIHHISVERVLSFSGLLSVFEFLVWKFPEQLRPETKEQYAACLSESPTYSNTSLPPSPEVPRRGSFSSTNPPNLGYASATNFNPTPTAAVRYVVNRGKEQSDELCVQTLTLFCRILASEAGNFALNTLPFGGLYLAGGIIPEIKEVLTIGSKFLDHFQNKGRLQKILQRVPIYLVTHPDPYLLGCIFICRSLLENKPLPSLATPAPSLFTSPSSPIPNSPLTNVRGMEKRLQETLSAPPPSQNMIDHSFSYPFDNPTPTALHAPSPSSSGYSALPSPRLRSPSLTSLRPPVSPSLPPQTAPFGSADQRKQKKTVHKTDLSDGLSQRDDMISKSYTKLRSVLHPPTPVDDDDDDDDDGEEGDEKSSRDFIIMSTLMVSTVVLSVSLAATLGYLLAKKNQ